MNTLARACVAMLLAASAVASAAVPLARLQLQDSGVDVRLRGISAVDANIAWASGQKGSVLRTVDGGTQWQADACRRARKRWIFAMSRDSVPSRGGAEHRAGRSLAHLSYRRRRRLMALTLQNTDSRGFFDCMAFEGERGWMLGDPVDGRYQFSRPPMAVATGRPSKAPKQRRTKRHSRPAAPASRACTARWRSPVAGPGARPRPRRWTARMASRKMPAWPRRKPEAGVFSWCPAQRGWFAVGGDYRARRRRAMRLSVRSAIGEAAHRAARLWLGCRLRGRPAAVHRHRSIRD